MSVKVKFLDYVSYDTQSDSSSTTMPSTMKQKLLAKHLADEMVAMGIEDAHMDEWGYVYGTIPANCEKKNVVGFIAHMDTAEEVSGANVKARVIENYNGEDIVLNKELGIVTDVENFPILKKFKGKTLIVTDGTTLLGADDKAGVAEIMQAAEDIIKNNLPHGEIHIAFTPDEEIGQGADHFDVEKFGCDWGYTIDGGQIGELEYENFNAAGAKIIFKGLNVHPGYAKDKMQNASLRAIEFASWLPAEQRPEHTTGYEGFFHLTGMTGSVEEATLSYIIRDHDRKLFEEKKELLRTLVDKMNEAHPGCAHLELRDQYYNMREVVEPQKHIVDLAFEAMTSVGVEPIVKPIRGGTDGARLSFMGLPCPNIFAGGLNFHGRYEFLPVRSLEKSMETVIKIIELSARKS